MPSVVVAAHNEEAVIGACLEALLTQGIEPLDIVVVPNGCTDATADRARAYGVTVVERREPGKSAAVNAGDEAARGFPRIYLDADIVLPHGAIETVVQGFVSNGAVLAVAPGRRVETAGCAWPVRAYFAINGRLPAFDEGLFGRGMFVLSEEGRGRFTRFPELIADDLFADSVFAGDEKATVRDVMMTVQAPRTTRALLARLERVRRGNAELRSAASELGIVVRPSDRWAWLRDVVLPNPRLWPAAVPYVVITTLAARRAGRAADPAIVWGRDETTRTGAHPIS